MAKRTGNPGGGAQKEGKREPVPAVPVPHRATHVVIGRGRPGSSHLRILEVPSTEVKNKFGATLGEVRDGGIVRIMRHQELEALVFSPETLRTLLRGLDINGDLLKALFEQESSDPLSAHRDDFEALLTHMQTSESIDGVQALMDATPSELGKAAVTGARRDAELERAARATARHD